MLRPAGPLLALLLLHPASLARADEVVFTDGSRQTGCTVTEETHQVVAYTIPIAGQSSGVRQQRKASEVREVIYDDPPAALRRGIALLEYGEQERALQAFQEARPPDRPGSASTPSPTPRAVSSRSAMDRARRPRSRPCSRPSPRRASWSRPGSGWCGPMSWPTT